MKNSSIQDLLRRSSIGIIAAGLTLFTPAFANEDEWYDPTDWFDNDNVELNDPIDGYNYDYDVDKDWNSYDAWTSDYDANYWDGYGWSPDSENASNSATASTGSNNSSSSGRQVSSSSGSSAADDAIVHTLVVFATPASEQSDPQMSRLKGTVEGVSETNLKRESGATGKHTLARIKLEDGKSTVVSLGRSSSLKNVDLKEGKEIEAIGRKGQIDGKTVFVANRLRIDGRTIEAHPAIQLTGQSNDRSKSVAQNSKNRSSGNSSQQSGDGMKQQQTFKGEVATINRVSIGNEHTLVELELENGKSCTVDFGPAAELERIGLQKGDRVTVRGKMTDVRGRQVVKPELLRIDGDRIESVSNS